MHLHNGLTGFLTAFCRGPITIVFDTIVVKGLKDNAMLSGIPDGNSRLHSLRFCGRSETTG